MKNRGKFKESFLIAVLLGILFCFSSLNSVHASENKTEYGEPYRNQLAYSAKQGWNNDPNGLIYVNGVYHMYYQYNWDQRKDESTDIVWGNMSWGHATSEDLVHWEEQPVALPAYQSVNGISYDMMFSGSAVYDEKNTSGLFEMENGKLKEGHGIIAILTQPTDVQRQILAYSYDNGNSFQIYGEVLGSDNEGNLNDNEFRDPKVFWYDELGKWLMVVGGGAVRMYASDNLKDWKYLGQTGLWGECPDISCYTINNEKKYALIISPEDKKNSHLYNQTSSKDTFYPAEYYTVGDINEDGLFVPAQPLKRLSEGMDSYAFQSFNNAPDGRVYGISWSANWKNVDYYKDYRKTFNGGMTIACELELDYDDSGYFLRRKPVSKLTSLRGDELLNYQGEVTNRINPLQSISCNVADIELELDFNQSEATIATLELRKSLAERIIITYDKLKQEFIFNRKESSLMALDTPYYEWENRISNVALQDGKLSLRILLDRAFISIFINDGHQSIFSAVFPSTSSNQMSLSSDQSLQATAKVYQMKSIFGSPIDSSELVVSTKKLDLTTNDTKKIIASSLDDSIDVTYTIKEGAENIQLIQDGTVAIVKGIKPGKATLLANDQEIEIFIYEDGLESTVEYDSKLYGYSYKTDQGLILEHQSDAFLFGNQFYEDFIYHASIDVLEDGQAAGLLFGLSENKLNYWVATVDFKDNVIKLWQAGVGDLKVIPYDFKGQKSCNLSILLQNKTVTIQINDDKSPKLVQILSDYNGGMLGLNVYHSKTAFNHIYASSLEELEYDGQNEIQQNVAGEVVKIINVSDQSYRLKEDEFSYEDGILKINQKYLNSLKAGKSYIFRIVTSDYTYDQTIHILFEEAKLSSEKTEFKNTDSLVFYLDGTQHIQRVYLDNIALDDYEFIDQRLILPQDYSMHLVSGSHTITVYTDLGRPTFEFSISEVFDGIIEEENVANHVFFYVDISLFAVVIIAYVAFTIYKRKKKGGKKHE